MEGESVLTELVWLVERASRGCGCVSGCVSEWGAHDKGACGVSPDGVCRVRSYGSFCLGREGPCSLHRARMSLQLRHLDRIDAEPGWKETLLWMCCNKRMGFATAAQLRAEERRQGEAFVKEGGMSAAAQAGGCTMGMGMGPPAQQVSSREGGGGGGGGGCPMGFSGGPGQQQVAMQHDSGGAQQGGAPVETSDLLGNFNFDALNQQLGGSPGVQGQQGQEQGGVNGG